MASWQQNIEVYTRELDITDISTAQLSILIADTVNEWVEKAPIELLYKHCAETVLVPTNGLLITDSKILKVFREGKGCAMKDFEEHHLFSDTSSLHYATPYTPVFYVETSAASEVTDDIPGPHLKVFPLLETGETAHVHKFEYFSTITASAETNLVLGLPPRMVPLIILSVTEKVLAHKLGMMVHEEEDAEITGIINSQLQFVQMQIQSQAVRIGIGDPLPGKAHMYTKGQQ